MSGLISLQDLPPLFWAWAASILLIFNLTVLLWSLLTAFWSVRQIRKETHLIWDESERCLYRLRKALDQIEGEAENRRSE